MTLTDTLAGLFTRRAALVTEIATIDAELAEARAVLGTVDLPPAPSDDGPIEKTCEVCGQPYPQRSNRQRICVACRAATPHRAVEVLNGTQTPNATCETCGERFVWTFGTSGRFCSRACWAMPVEDRRPLILKALEAGPIGASDLTKQPGLVRVSRQTIANDLQALRREGVVHATAAGWVLTRVTVEPAAPVSAPVPPVAPPVVEAPPKRPYDLAQAVARTRATVTATPREDPGPLALAKRCALCFQPFKPKLADQLVCLGCIGKPLPAPVTPPVLESVWAGGEGLSRYQSGVAAKAIGL